MDTGQAFLLLETAATIFMAGVLWTMQLLNYPLLALVGTEAFPRYEAAHNRRFALVVVPGVLAAAAGGIGLVASRPGQVPLWAPACELALLLVVIISTAAAGPPARGARGRLRPADAPPAGPLQLDPGGRLVGGGRPRAVDVPPGVPAMSTQITMAHPAGQPPHDHDQRHRANPATRCTLNREGSA